MIRQSIFWIHLACGLTAGLVIAMMSVTGVMLTYERQLLAWADAHAHAPIDPAAGERQSLDALLAAARDQDPEFTPTSMAVSGDPKAAVMLGAGRGGGTRLVDPYTGELLGEGATRWHAFFRAVTGWHRWFNAEGAARGPARAITAASNLVFLFLLFSGLYLWLPPVFRWAMLRMHLWFNPSARTGKARDYNWHHVFGIWTALPLIVIVYSATVFSYDFSSDLLYRAFGEEAPQRGRPQSAPTGAGARAASGPARARDAAETAQFAGEPAEPDGTRLPLDVLFAAAASATTDWRTITLQVPARTARSVQFTIDRGTGGQPQHRHSLTLDAGTGAALHWEPFTSQTPGRRARRWIRFLHTGEAFGLAGQTVAGVVSAASVIMVWTGFALAWRRLVTPWLGRRLR